ncbi:MAG: hypothetical protein WBQ95_08745 [Terracidiphilus sp.]
MNAIGAVSTKDGSATVPPPRLVRAAHEFEAQLMKELLKPMTNGATLDGDDQGSGGVLADFATEALGQALSQHGGLGIATNILHSLSQNEKKVPPSPNSGVNERVSPNIGAAGLT